MDFPNCGLVREKQILGDPRADPPIPPFIPVSRAQWWKGIAQGIYPSGRKFGPRMRMWTAEEIWHLKENGVSEPDAA